MITGAGGFIGSHLTELCVAKGYQVKAFVHYNSKNSWGWLESSEIKKEIEVVAGDVRDFDSVYRAMEGMDQVLHLAALIGIPYSYVSPQAYIRTNIDGTYNVLESARLHNTKNVVVTSTSETYGTAQYIPIDESHPLVGQSPYSATKIAADQLAVSYYRSFDLPVKIMRPFNTYGPRQSARAVIPTIITQLLSGKTELKLGNLHPTRDLTFVKDTARAFLAVGESDKFNGEFVNAGMSEEITIGDLVKMIIRLSGKDAEIVEDQERIRPGKSEVERLFCANKKLIENTDWRPEYTLESGISETISWLEKNLDLYKADIYNV